MKNLIFALLITFLSVHLSAYAEDIPQEFTKEGLADTNLLSKLGNCDKATAKYAKHLSSSNIKVRAYSLGLTGAIIIGCSHDNAKGIGYLNLAARYGSPQAQALLVQLGAPVPSADLASSSDLKPRVEEISDTTRALKAISEAVDDVNRRNDREYERNRPINLNCIDMGYGTSSCTNW